MRRLFCLIPHFILFTVFRALSEQPACPSQPCREALGRAPAHAAIRAAALRGETGVPGQLLPHREHGQVTLRLGAECQETV